ncbi:MAG: hypothetical protein E6K35_11235 [Gammaproteobacteria bacterium]|nr:MAG: hypothetical protein E6K35_11235 [Gammaproteobacteria bacterium]
MASVAAAWFIGHSSLAQDGGSSSGCLTLRLTPEERNAHARGDGALQARAPVHIPGMSGANMAVQPENL